MRLRSDEMQGNPCDDTRSSFWVEYHGEDLGTDRFWTTDVSSRMRRPFSPSTLWVRVARMMISVRMGVTRTSTPA